MGYLFFCGFSWLSLGEADWKLILLRADIGIFLLMVWKLILSIFGVLDTSSFEKLGRQWPEVFFVAKCFVPKALTMFLKMFFQLFWMIWMRKLIQKNFNELSWHVGESPPIEQLDSWCVGLIHLLINASRGNLRSTLLAVATARGLGWPKNGKWFEVGSWYSKTKVGYEWIRVGPILSVYISYRHTMDVHVVSLNVS